MLVCGCSREPGTEKGSRAGKELTKWEGKCRKGSVCLYDIGNSVGTYFEEFINLFCMLRKSEGWLFKSKKDQKDTEQNSLPD